MRSYEQYCPLARALDVVGDRWAMLVLRELFFTPKRFTDLQTRLEGIAPNLLSRRLKELEAAELIARRRLDPPASATVYELTERGRSLEPAMLELARWGTQFLGSYEGDEAFNLEWLIPVMEEMADREAARGVRETYEFIIDGVPFSVKVDDGKVMVRAGHAPGVADLLVETDLATFMEVGFGRLSPEDAQSQGRSRVVGDASKVDTALDILAPVRVLSKVAVA
ncbi:MAG: winged helix-turn-helix transcriptional regulator [Actinomycetota bacterium]